MNIQENLPPMKDNLKSILFVIPSISLGGTTTALAGILNSDFTQNHRVDVYAIIDSNNHLDPVSNYDVGHNGLTSAFYGNFSSFDIWQKINYLWVKLLIQVKVLYPIIESWILRKTIKRLEKSRRYDYIVGFQEGLATRFARHFACKNKIAWIHCDYARAFGTVGKEEYLYQHYSKIVCVSNYTRKSFVDIYPMFAGKTIAIHNIFDAKNVIEKSQDPVEDERFDTSLFTIISLGRICDVKRFYLIPEIISKLKEYNVSIRWYILGNVNEQKELDKLNLSIKQNGTEAMLVYLGSKKNPYPYLKASDLMVSVSSSEACPMIFNEAKILHVPILSSDFGSAFEFIEQGVDGYITPIEQMPKKIVELITCQSDLKKIIQSEFKDSNNEIQQQLTSLFS